MKVQLLAAGGIASALVASTCCIVPLALVSVGVSGAWIGSLTALAPYQPIFILIALLCLGAGFWMVYRRSPADCNAVAHGKSKTSRLIMSALWLKAILWVGAGLVALSLGADYGVRLFL